MNTKIIYEALEKITFGKGLPKTVNGVKVKLPAKYIRYFPSNYEAENFDFLKESIQPNSVVFDIGAHIGLFSIIAAKLIGNGAKIFAFEPAPSTQKVLNQTIAINHLQQNVIPVNAAMGKEPGSITFFVSDDEADNSNSLVSYKEDRKLHGIEVKVDNIDHFAAAQKLTQIGFIKIDVEGAEYDTLRGGIHVFKTLRPNFILAIHPEPIAKKGDKLEDIYNLLIQLDYSIEYNAQAMSKEAFCANKEMIDLHLRPL
jgi:FkbM family methyltransferase